MQTLDDLRSGALAGSRRLALSCNLEHFPEEIFQLADSLEILDLSNNALSSLPDDLYRLRKLRVIFCSNNRFTALPHALGRCAELSMVGFKANQISAVPADALPAKLRWLILTDNQIETLPSELGRCTRLQKLMLAGNRLPALPASLVQCQQLELLRIAANRLSELPPWLLDMPRLSWLAYAGNPFCTTAENSALDNAPIRPIRWPSLRLERQLGEGASGVIHQAEHAAGDSVAQTVAVKLFKGEVTSDGLPLSEMAACIAAGPHPNLVPVLGKVVDHPDKPHGLVMALIDPAFANLAGPPSLESCTRDIYPAERRFTPHGALRIAHGIASATAQLHARGLMHGDLYGHNMLVRDDGQVYLGDFGAASFHATANPATSQALQGLEVRAFGCLLEELLERVAPTQWPAEARSQLVQLQRDCFNPSPARRPPFGAIERCLETLMAPDHLRPAP